MPRTAVRTHRVTLTVPAPVQDFFAALTEFGTVTGVSENSNAGVSLNIPAADVTDAVQKTMRLAQRLGGAGIAPAFPSSTYGNIPSYRWVFDTPIYAGDGHWAVLVPITDDLSRLLSVVSGMGEWANDYRGEPVLPVTFYPEDAADLAEMTDEVKSELSAWFAEPIRLTPVQDS